MTIVSALIVLVWPRLTTPLLPTLVVFWLLLKGATVKLAAVIVLLAPRFSVPLAEVAVVPLFRPPTLKVPLALL